MNLDDFESYLISKGKSPNTSTSYVKNVARCLKKKDAESYILSIKSKKPQIVCQIGLEFLE